MIQRVTIDTMYINAKGRDAALNTLEALAARGLIEITSTFALAKDLSFDHSQLAESRRTKAARLRQARSGFVVGRSTVGGPDVVGGPNVYAHVDAIARVIAPSQAWQQIDSHTQRDILHLAAHLTYGWELFLTKEKRILRRAADLSALGLRVMNVEDALVHLQSVGIS